MVNYICIKCNQNFLKKYNYLKHVNKKFDCTPKTIIINSESVLNHEVSKMNHDFNENKYSCKYCKKIFFNSSNLSRHIKLNNCKVKKIQDEENNKIEDSKNQKIESFEKEIIDLKQIINEQNIKINKLVTNTNPVNDKLLKIISDKDKQILELTNKQSDEVKLQNFIKIEYRETDNYINATQLCKADNKNFDDWYNLDSTKELIIELTKNQKEILIEKKYKTIFIHPDLAIQLAQWISPKFAIQVSKWIRELYIENNIKLNNELELKDERIKTLEKYYKLKQKQTIDYQDKNVIYIITTKQNKLENIYIIGSTIDLKKRLSTYNKSCEHEIVFSKSCNNKKEMLLIENIVLTKLNAYREKSNRDRFVLPIDATIDLFINIVNDSIRFFEKNINTDNLSEKE